MPLALPSVALLPQQNTGRDLTAHKGRDKGICKLIACNARQEVAWPLLASKQEETFAVGTPGQTKLVLSSEPIGSQEADSHRIFQVREFLLYETSSDNRFVANRLMYNQHKICYSLH